LRGYKPINPNRHTDKSQGVESFNYMQNIREKESVPNNDNLNYQSLQATIGKHYDI